MAGHETQSKRFHLGGAASERANGRVVVVADNLDEVAKQLRLAEPDPAKTYGIEAGLDYDEVQEIWGT